MKIYAVIDTNVIISAPISKNQNSPTIKILNAVFDGFITPLSHSDILAEYDDVLHRAKFKLNEATIDTVLRAFKQFGVEVLPKPTGEILVDMDDLIFYEVAMEKRDDNAYLVTGNQKHYPVRAFIVTPSEMLDILEKK